MNVQIENRKVYKDISVFQALKAMDIKKSKVLFVFDDNDELDFLIEFQGIQHYEAKSKFGGITGLRRQQYNDMKKREYCAKHGITLVAIPYWDEGRMDYDYIMRAAGY